MIGDRSTEMMVTRIGKTPPTAPKKKTSLRVMAVTPGRWDRSSRHPHAASVYEVDHNCLGVRRSAYLLAKAPARHDATEPDESRSKRVRGGTRKIKRGRKAPFQSATFRNLT